MTVKLIASDMDGTFLNEGGVYDQARFIRLLDRLEAKGIRFVVSSGNNMARLNMIFEGLIDRLDFVSDNGSRVLVGREEIASQALEREDVLALLDYFKGHWMDYRLMVSSGDQSFCQQGMIFDMPTAMVTPEQAKAFQDMMIPLADLQRDLPNDISIKKITMMVDVADCDRIMTEFNRDFEGNLTATTSGYGAIDILKTGITKAWGLEQLLRHYGYDSSQLMAFGDGGNDIEMLALAGQAYAMDNAPAFVKAVADAIAPSHKNDGVLQVIEAYLDQLAEEH